MSIRTRINNAVQAFRGKGAEGTISTTSQINSAATNPWSAIGGMFIPRQVNASLYEALREALPVIDAGINRLVTMDGIIAVEGENDALVQEIDEWMRNVRVNDMETGFQSFQDSLGNETYEQGCAIGEFIADAKQSDLIALRVADSKGLRFRRANGAIEGYYQAPGATTGRGDGTDRVQQVMRNTFGALSLGDIAAQGYKPLNLSSCVYQSIHNEADNPYGTSIMRSMEFVSRIVLNMQNNTDLMWHKYGDPPLSVTYKTKNRALKQADLDKRTTSIAEKIREVMTAKRNGNSAEFVQAIGADDDLTITVIGAQDKVIEIETPARHMLEQIVAKFSIPAWMLGLHWGTSERLAESQGIIVLQESQTRFARREPTYSQVIRTMLRLRGRTWRHGDWRLAQRLPNLKNILQEAQAEFLRAQTALMLSGALGPNGNPPVIEGDDEGAKRLRASIDRMSAKLTGMDSDSRRALMADPTAIDRMVSEAMD